MLTISAAVISCAFLVLGAAVWVSQEGLLSSSVLVTRSRNTLSILDQTSSILIEAGADDKICRFDRDDTFCFRTTRDRQEFRFRLRQLAQFADDDKIRLDRLRGITDNLKAAMPVDMRAPDNKAVSVVTSLLKSLRNYEQMQLDHRLDKFNSLAWKAQQAMIALLTVGTILLVAGQGVLWKGIRRQRRTQQQLEDLNSNLTLARREALALSEAKGRFLADMSHEIRTPLNGIVGMASMLSLGDLTQSDADIVRTIRASSDILLRVVDDVLDLSKIDSNRVELLNQPFEINGLLRDVSNLYRGMADDHRNRLVLSIPDTDQWVLGDAVRLKQVFGNLVSNAVKFCREGEIGISISNPSQDMYAVTVSDTGVGIAADRLDEIFDEFVQAQVSVSQEHPGTGLGLAIARKLVRRMKGEISVTSRLDIGSVFTVVVPLPSCAPPTPVKSEDGPSIRGLKVLLAEDNNVNTLVATSILQRAGCIVDIARDGVQATEMAVQGAYEVILMDLRMPQRQGIEATVEILRSFEGRPGRPSIIAMTANASPEDREACMSVGMVGFLPKPFTYELLVEALQVAVPTPV
jgi:signal transduction histidine kinase